MAREPVWRASAPHALLGSLVRGERHEESDVDVAIEIDDPTSHEAREVGYAPGDILTEYGILPFVVSSVHGSPCVLESASSRSISNGMGFRFERDQSA